MMEKPEYEYMPSAVLVDVTDLFRRFNRQRGQPDFHYLGKLLVMSGVSKEAAADVEDSSPYWEYFRTRQSQFNRFICRSIPDEWREPLRDEFTRDARRLDINRRKICTESAFARWMACWVTSETQHIRST